MNEQYFPDAFREGQQERVEKFWDLSNRLPVPRDLTCPACSGRLVLKDWKFHLRRRSAAPWRCDVRLKCVDCSFVPMFGVSISKQMYDRSKQFNPGGDWIHWRLGKEVLEEDGFFNES